MRLRTVRWWRLYAGRFVTGQRERSRLAVEHLPPRGQRRRRPIGLSELPQRDAAREALDARVGRRIDRRMAGAHAGERLGLRAAARRIPVAQVELLECLVLRGLERPPPSVRVVDRALRK